VDAQAQTAQGTDVGDDERRIGLVANIAIVVFCLLGVASILLLFYNRYCRKGLGRHNGQPVVIEMDSFPSMTSMTSASGENLTQTVQPVNVPVLVQTAIPCALPVTGVPVAEASQALASYSSVHVELDPTTTLKGGEPEAASKI